MAKRRNTLTQKPKHTVINNVKGEQYLAIGWDSDNETTNVKKWYPVLTVGYEITDHRHIQLSRKQMKKLHSWLSKFIEVTEGAKHVAS